MFGIIFSILTAASFLFAGILALIVYFVPTIVAYNKKHENLIVIFLLNLFFAPTVIIWFLLLFWALSDYRIVKK